MADFKVEIQGLKELQKALKDYPKISGPIFHKAMSATATIFFKHTQKNDPIPWRTGFLFMSFRHTFGPMEAKWGPTVKYAPYVEFGRGEVVPVNKMALSWKNVGGGRIFAKRSRPASARPFMQKIVDKSTDDVNKLFVKALDAINQRIANQK